MFKPGSFYLTCKGQLVKIFDIFKFQDGFVYNAAIYIVGTGWMAARYNKDGACNVDGANNNIIAFEPVAKYPNYMQFLVWFDRTTLKWRGRASDPRGAVIVDLNDIDHRERAMQLIQRGAEQRVLAWMHEAGYDEDKKELVDA